MDQRGMRAVDINRMKPALLNSFLSRIVRGDQKYLSQESLSDLADCFSTHEGLATPEDAASLIAAHLRDGCVGPGADLVKIKVARNGKHKAPSRIDQTLDYIRQRVVTDAKMQALVDSLAELMGMPHCIH